MVLRLEIKRLRRVLLFSSKECVPVVSAFVNSFSVCFVFFSELLVFPKNFRLVCEEALHLVLKNLLPRAQLQRGLLLLTDRHVYPVFVNDFGAEISGRLGHLRLCELIKNCQFVELVSLAEQFLRLQVQLNS